MKTKAITLSRLIGGSVCAGAVLLGGSPVLAQTVFFGDWVNIYKFSPTGGGAFSQTTIASNTDYARGLAFDSAGDLLEADSFSGQILEYANNKGTYSSTPTVFANGLAQPSGMAYNIFGDLFVTSATANEVYEFTPGNATPAILSITGLDQPQGIAFDSLGNMYVSNWGSGTVTKITPQNVQSTYASDLTNPVGLAFDHSGDLFVADAGSGIITEINSADEASTYVTGLAVPQQIALDGNGDLFVADSSTKGNNGDLTEILPNKTEDVIFSDPNAPLSVAVLGQALPVPEPSSVALLAVGAAGLLIRRKK
jgi:hypothetical protein